MADQPENKSSLSTTSRVGVVGLSISRCILAIAEGKVPERVVVKIIGGTHFYNLDDLWNEYSQKHWAEHQLRARTVFNRLVKEGRLIQPRMSGQPAPDATAGIWKVGSSQMDTPQLLDFLDICESFLDMTHNRREDFFDFLPQEALQKLFDHLLTARLDGFFPEFAKVTANLPAHVIFGMLKDRLKQFFRTAPDVERTGAAPAILQILAPFFKTFRGSPVPKKPSGILPFAHSQYLGRKPPDEPGKEPPDGPGEEPPDKPTK